MIWFVWWLGFGLAPSSVGRSRLRSSFGKCFQNVTEKFREFRFAAAWGVRYECVMFENARERIDSHQHFWSYDPAQYPWIAPGSALQRDWLPSDLAPLLADGGFGGSIAVQARQTVEESRWLLELAEHHSFIKGVVGWLDLRSPAIESQLEAFSRHPKFVGVRHVAQDEPDDRFLLSEAFLIGIAALNRHRLAYDLLVYPRQLTAAIVLAAKFPAQMFVLDHIGKPPIRDGTMTPWKERIQELAKAPNVWCKVSGMVTEADHAGWKASDLRPYLDVVFEAFGPNRLMFGSDWPVCLLASSYDRVAGVVEDYVSQLTKAEQADLFGGNARRFYRIAPSA